MASAPEPPSLHFHQWWFRCFVLRRRNGSLYFWDSRNQCLHRISIWLGEPNPGFILAAAPSKGTPGDLYVYLDIEEIPEIQRDGISLTSTVTISYLDAILGTIVKVKTVDGLSDLHIPPGTQPGDVLVSARKGAPKLNNLISLCFPAKNVQTEVDSGTEKSEAPEEQNDLWKSLKDLAGSVANGALKWLPDNI